MIELNEKIEVLKQELNEIDSVKEIKQILKEINEDKEFCSLFEEYHKTYDEKVKDEILTYEVLRKYKKLENEINFIILEINQKLKVLDI